jgi:hypothetical protein
MQDFYNIIISPETINGDLSVVNYKGTEVGVYSAMTQVVSSGPNGSSLLNITVPILLRQTAIDVGYFSPFDGAVLQKDVVANFIFSSTTSDPYKYYVYNTSSEFQKFLDLSAYRIDWGDGTPKEIITTYVPNSLNHTYTTANAQYNITLEQTNPWGITRVSKTITTPFTDVVIYNPQGTSYFIPAGGNWLNTPVSYDYIFSGDAINEVSAQTSNNYVTVPYTISGITKSRINELSLYGANPVNDPLYNASFQIGVPVISNGQIWGAVTNATHNVFTAYTIQNVEYYDYSDGTTMFFEQSSGFTINNLTAVPITKEEVLINVIDQPQIQTDVFVERGKNSAYERVQRLGEVDNLGDMLNYGYGFFNVQKNP